MPVQPSSSETPSADADMVDLSLSAVALLASEQEAIVATWQELCQWDPMLPPDSRPPIAMAMVSALCGALSRPQPIGWGADPEMERVVTVFARRSGTVEVSVGQLVCLREAIRRRVVSQVPEGEREETEQRLNMIVDRAIATAAMLTAERLEEQAYLDELTQLLNRRALQRDLRREIGRAARYNRRFGVMVIDLDGLKRINDREGHAAGDETLRRLADALREALRSGDAAYRIGGDEFVALLPETRELPLAVVPDRIKAAGAPSFSWGIAVYPNDGAELDELVSIADARLYEQRERTRRKAD